MSAEGGNGSAITAFNLCKTFAGGMQAVSALDLAVPRGAVYGLLGRNGAGKTTALRLLMGLLRATSGTAAILGQDMWRADHRHRQRVAYVSQEQQIHAWMSFDQLVDYVAHFYDRWDQAHARALAHRFGIARDVAVGLLSGGQRRLAAVILALAARPEVLVLDEPAAGLDPVARRGLIDALIDALGEGADSTILLSTHICSDLERLANHIGIMDWARPHRWWRRRSTRSSATPSACRSSSRATRLRLASPSPERVASRSAARCGARWCRWSQATRSRAWPRAWALACRPSRSAWKRSSSKPWVRPVRRFRRRSMSEPQITTPISAADVEGSPSSDRPAVRTAARLPPHIRGLLAREWLAHHRLLCACWALWLAFGLALPLFHHPGWILALGIAYALGVAPAIGGLDAREGSEEFAFGLPATRSEIYRTRAALCIGTLITLLAAGLGSIALSLPGHLWSLVADSGFATPFPSTGLAWYVYAAMVPLALSACTFATAISSGSGSALGATLLGLLLGWGGSPAPACRSSSPTSGSGWMAR